MTFRGVLPTTRTYIAKGVSVCNGVKEIWTKCAFGEDTACNVGWLSDRPLDNARKRFFATMNTHVVPDIIGELQNNRTMTATRLVTQCAVKASVPRRVEVAPLKWPAGALHEVEGDGILNCTRAFLETFDASAPQENLTAQMTGATPFGTCSSVPHKRHRR